MGSIDDILSDEPSNEPVAEETVQEEPVQPDPQPEGGPMRDEKGRFAPKGETEGASPAPVNNEFDPAPVIAERRRRQEAEKQLDEMRQRLAALESPPTPPPSIWDDEQGWQQHFGGQVVQTAVQQATLNAKLDMSEMMVRQANPDFEEMKELFLSLAEKSPVLREQALADPHPWNKAYQIARNHKAMEELGATDVDSLKAKIREELMAEMAQQPAAPRPGLPPTLSTEQSVASRTGPVWSGPRPLSDLLS